MIVGPFITIDGQACMVIGYIVNILCKQILDDILYITLPVVYP